MPYDDYGSADPSICISHRIDICSLSSVHSASLFVEVSKSRIREWFSMTRF